MRSNSDELFTGILTGATNQHIQREAEASGQIEPLWKRKLSLAREYIIESGLDGTNPKHFDVLLSKMCTRQIVGGKGVILIGGVGSGKTARMRLFKRICLVDMESAADLCNEWRQCGDNDQYFREVCKVVPSHLDVVPPFENDLIIDDLGIEPAKIVQFGTPCDVMIEKVIPWRYEVFPQRKTYFTTNLTQEQLHERYGERIYSRLCEMCVFVTVDHTDWRIINNEK